MTLHHRLGHGISIDLSMSLDSAEIVGKAGFGGGARRRFTGDRTDGRSLLQNTAPLRSLFS
jgi:hypothetical protein